MRKREFTVAFTVKQRLTEMNNFEDLAKHFLLKNTVDKQNVV
jgi:hypothetical protein